MKTVSNYRIREYTCTGTGMAAKKTKNQNNENCYADTITHPVHGTGTCILPYLSLLLQRVVLSVRGDPGTEIRCSCC